MLKTLRAQIILMVAIPLVGLCLSSMVAILDKQETSEKFEILQPLAIVSQSASSLIHELQKERGKTVGMITSSYDEKNVTTVQEQRVLTDDVMTSFIKILDDNRAKIDEKRIEQIFQNIKNDLLTLKAHRTKIDAQAVEIPENVKFYTDIIQHMITLISNVIEASPSEELTHVLLPYLSLIQAKEASGLERAIGSALFNKMAANEFSLKQYLLYYSKLSEEKAFLSSFRSFASSEFIERFDTTVKGSDVDQVTAWRAVLADMPNSKDGKGIDGKNWFDTATKRINLIYAVEQSIGAEAVELSFELHEKIQSEKYSLIALNIAILVLAAVIAIVVAKRISKGLATITEDISTLGEGRHNFEVRMQDRKDEFGDIARVLEIFRRNAQEKEELEIRALKLQQKAEEERKSLTIQLASEFEQTVGISLNQLSAQCDALEKVCMHLADKSDQGTSRSLNVAEGAIAASTEVEKIAMSGQEMALSISEVSRNVASTSASMQAIVENVDGAAKSIEQLQSASQEIGNVVQMITDIAGQTNLLALNATIEAARAGEAGKGFAVVASEVKTLSHQTENATSQISQEVIDIQKRTLTAVEMIRKVEQAIVDADKIINAIASAVEEQAVTTQQMSQNMGQVSKATNDVTEDISYVCQASASSCGTGIQVLWTVDDLKGVKANIEEASFKFLQALKSTA